MPYTNFQFPLLGFLLCIWQGWQPWRLQQCLSIPFIGIFALHQFYAFSCSSSLIKSFNSLYWDFCFASEQRWMLRWGLLTFFQFPLLGFLLCIDRKTMRRALTFQVTFNSLYWDFCFASFNLWRKRYSGNCGLSIPFIGIFALHPWLNEKHPLGGREAFNSLYWDFCFASQIQRTVSPSGLSLSIPFIGIFALHHPLFLFLKPVDYMLSIPFIGIFALHLRQT